MKLTGYYTIQGATMTAQAIAQGARLNITGIYAGSGNTGLHAVTLTQQKQQLSLTGRRASASGLVLEAALQAEDAGSKYTLTEIGVYARVGTGIEMLYKIYRMDEGLTIEPDTDLSIAFYLSEKLVPADQVNVTVDREGYATLEAMDEAIAAACDGQSAALTAHKNDGGAHSALFAAKANAAHSHSAGDIGAGTLAGQVAACANTNYTAAQVRSVVLSQNTPSGGQNGSLWIQYA